MMEEVIFSGIPDERKGPFQILLKKLPIFPKSLVIDIIDVNKTPNKRIFEKADDTFDNVLEGTAVTYNDVEGLLVACGSHVGTAQPLEISIKKTLMSKHGKHSKTTYLKNFARILQANVSKLGINFQAGKVCAPADTYPKFRKEYLSRSIGSRRYDFAIR